MSDHAINVSPLSSAALLEGFLNIAAEAFAEDNLRLEIATNVAPLSYSIKTTGRGLQEHEDITRARGDLAKLRSIALSRITLTTSNNTRLTYTLRPNAIGSIELENVNASSVIHLLPTIEKNLPIATVDEAADELLPVAAQSVLAYLRQSVASLQAETANIARFSLEQQRRQDEFLHEKIIECEQTFRSRHEELDRLHAEKDAGLTEREESLKKHTEEFDLRQNTLVRRDRLRSITTQLGGQKEVTLSEATGKKRRVLRGFFIGALVLGVVGIFVFGDGLLQAASGEWMRYLPLTASGLFFVGMLIYYLRWEDAWFRQHASAEFQNAKLAIDIQRADWLAELLFEWQKSEKAGDIPPELVKQFSTDLFVATNDHTAKHPIEDLEGLIRSIPHIRIDRDSLEVSGRKRS